MYLSRLSFNQANREARRNFRTPYHLHATIMKGFPHQQDTEKERVLFRHEPNVNRSMWADVLVQSQIQPDWYPLIQRLDSAIRCESKLINLQVQNGQRLRFRLRANPVIKRNNKRLPLRGEPNLRNWLIQRAEKNGFKVLDFSVQDEGDWWAEKGTESEKQKMHIATALYQGVLLVENTVTLQQTVVKGMGAAKGFGCGLLSLARV